MPQTKIKCPNCGIDVNVDEVFKHQAEDHVRKEYEEKFSKQVLALDKQREEVEGEKLKIKKLKEEQDDIIRRKLFEERDKLKAEAEFKAKKELEFEIFKLKQDYEVKIKENFQLKKKEVEIISKERELADKEIQLKLDMEKQIQDRTKAIEENAVEREKEQNELKNREYEKQLEEQKILINVFQKKEADMIAREKELKEREVQLRLDMEKQILDRTKMIEENAVRNLRELNNGKIREYERLLEEQKVLVGVFEKKEIDMINREKMLKDREVQLRSEMEKQIEDMSTELEEKVTLREQRKNELKRREYEKQLQDQKKLIDELKKKAEQGSIQMQGEVQELALEEFLKYNFPFDIIDGVVNGTKGADVIHIVRNNLQQECGRIIYESKRTKNFSDMWVVKIKDDLKSHQADLGVIVTESMPRDMERFGLRQGIWICTYNDIKSLSLVLREMLLKTHLVKSAQENRGEKMEMLYEYLTSNEFRQQVEAIIDAFTCLKTELDKEKRAMQRIWKEREKQIEKVFTNTIDMYGAVKGIAGSAIQNIKTLELPFPENEI